MTTSSNRFDKHLAEGSSEHALSTTNRYRSDALQRSQLRHMIVAEVITDPELLDEAFFARAEHDLGLRHAAMLRVAPRDSIIAFPKINNTEPESSPAVLLLPMLSHIRMPIRPGEHVLALFEDPEDVGSIGFWLSRIPTVKHADDPNIAHNLREHDPSFALDIKNPDKKPAYTFNNGVPTSDGVIIGETATLRGNQSAYESIITGSLAGSLRVIEPVVRYKRRVDDLSFEGARGALVVIGSERTSSAYKKTQQIERTEEDVKNSAAIHMSVGRNRVDNLTIVQNSLGFDENAKDLQSLNPKEGDHDFINDSAYMHISMATNNIDNLTGVKAPRISLGKDKASAIIFKSDDVRTVARRSIRISAIGAKQNKNDKLLIDDMKDSVLFDAEISAETGDVDTVIGHDLTVAAQNNINISCKNAAMQFDDALDIKSKSIKLGGDIHPAPAFDTFCSALADILDNLSLALSAGTAGGPTAQKLNGAEAFKIASSVFIKNLREAAAASGQFVSTKVKTG